MRRISGAREIGVEPGAATDGARAVSVSELCARIARTLEAQIGWVRVEGEISNLRVPQSGHGYFVLKDAESSLHAVCFRSKLNALGMRLADGKRVEVWGRVTAYTARSEYQIQVESAREAGVGDLLRQFIELRDRLKAEGLFEPTRKRPLPPYPRAIGLVTSGTGAALRDLLNVLGRRAGGISIYLAPCAVQGPPAPGQIVRAIRLIQRHARAEVVIVARGGGSLEDLWAFNDEAVVRAIASCRIPVVSGVGHETDTTLADYAADLRAPTPSAAAELVTANYEQLQRNLLNLTRTLNRSMGQIVSERRGELQALANSWALRRPIDRLANAMQRLDELTERLHRAPARKFEKNRTLLQDRLARLNGHAPTRRFQSYATILNHLGTRLESARPDLRWLPKLMFFRGNLEQMELRLGQAMRRAIHERSMRLAAVHGRLVALGPESVLQRGFSIITTVNGRRVITGPDQVASGQALRVLSAGGEWKVAALPNVNELFDQIDGQN